MSAGRGGLFSDNLSVVLSNLGPSELEKKRRVSKDFRETIDDNFLWNRFLKPEFRFQSSESPGKSRDIFIKHPACRLPQYVEIDQSGSLWLEEQLAYLNIDHPEMTFGDLALPGRLIEAGILTLKEAEDLPRAECGILIQLSPLFLSNKLDMKQFKQLQPEEHNKLNQLIKLIMADKLSISDALKLSDSEVKNIHYLDAYIIDGVYSVDEAKTMPTDACKNLCFSRGLIDSDKLTLEEAKTSDSETINDLWYLEKLIINNHINKQDVSQLSESERQSLWLVRELILANKISVEAAKKLSPQEVAHVANATHLITTEYLTLEEAKKLNLNEKELDNLNFTSPLIAKGLITLEQSNSLSSTQVCNLYHLSQSSPLTITEEDIELALKAGASMDFQPKLTPGV